MDAPLDLPSYPRALHLEGSGLPGDDKVARSALDGRSVVVEEKVDGRALAVLFDSWGDLHVADGQALVDSDPRLSLLRQWLQSVEHLLLEALEDRYVLYGEWLEDKHTIFYDALPHYFLEYDVYDRDLDEFLSTDRRQELLKGLSEEGLLASVAVLHQGAAVLPAPVPSCYKTKHWRESLAEAVTRSTADPELVRAQTLLDDLAEGLYVKVEEEGRVKERYKLVRPAFVEAILASGSHWSTRPRVRNRLEEGRQIFR